MKTSKQGGRDCYAIVAPGLEQLAAAELRSIGMTPGAIEPGGVEFQTDSAGVFAANLHLRTASRVIVRMAEFRATAFHELERLARTVRWDEFVAPGSTSRLRVTCRKSRLYHSDAVAQRIGDAIKRRVTGVTIIGGKHEADDDAGDEVPAQAAQLFLVRFQNDVCTISVDSSGELLHRRGYRLATAKAPLRETLAAAMLLAAGYDGSAPLMDPMCGAGTIPVEAALIARHIAPGLARGFSCEQWPGAPVKKFGELRAAARAAQLPARTVADCRERSRRRCRGRDGRECRTRRRNRRRRDSPRRALGNHATTGPGTPDCQSALRRPREFRHRRAKSLCAARQCRPFKMCGWTLAFLSADRAMDAQVKLALVESLKFKNGGIPVRLMRADVPDVAAKSGRV